MSWHDRTLRQTMTDEQLNQITKALERPVAKFSSEPASVVSVTSRDQKIFLNIAIDQVINATIPLTNDKAKQLLAQLFNGLTESQSEGKEKASGNPTFPSQLMSQASQEQRKAINCRLSNLTSAQQVPHPEGQASKARLTQDRRKVGPGLLSRLLS